MSDVNYDITLSLEKASLVARSRENNLGSNELVFDYNLANNSSKEEALNWLAANRLTITDPSFGHRTYTGVWNCIEIKYAEAGNTIRQRFKIDSSIGDLGDIGKEPDYALQTGDLATSSAGMDVFRAYYWRMVDPTAIVLPVSPDLEDGYIWKKSATDNGDGTYDVTVSKEVYKEQEGTSKKVGYSETEISVATINNTALTDSDITPATEGVVKSYSNTPLENGLFRTVLTTKTTVAQTGNEEVRVGTPITVDPATPAADVVESTDIIVSGMLNFPVANQTYRLTTSTPWAPTSEWEGRTNSDWVITSDTPTGLWEIFDSTDPSDIAARLDSDEDLLIRESGWFPPSNDPDTDGHPLVQIGVNEPPFTNDVDIYTGSDKLEFGTGVGDIPWPTVGQEVTISNVPQDDGQYRTTVTTVTANQQRIPALFGTLMYTSNGGDVYDPSNETLGATRPAELVVGKNATYTEFRRTINALNLPDSRDREMNNSVTVNMNRYGLFDYTIRTVKF